MATAYRRMPSKRAIRPGMVRRAWLEPLDLLSLEREIFGGLKRPQSEPTEREQALVPCQSQVLAELPVSVPDSRELAPAKSVLTRSRKPRAAKTTPRKAAEEVSAVFCPVAVLRIRESELALKNGVSSKLMQQLKELLENAAGR